MQVQNITALYVEKRKEKRIFFLINVFFVVISTVIHLYRQMDTHEKLVLLILLLVLIM